MNPKYILGAALTSLTLSSLASGAVIEPLNYNFLTAPNGSYPDSTGTELTDGIEQTFVWGGVNPIDHTPLVGWLNNNPGIQFNFSGTVTLQEVVVWFADSDGSAGVALPSEVTLRTSDNSFNQTFVINNPAGAGETVAFTLNGFSVDTDNLIVEATRSNQWTMISEVNFADVASVPEPSSTLLIALAGGAAFMRRKRS